MYFTYLAALWNPRDPAQKKDAERILDASAPRSWLPVLQCDGMTVFTQPAPATYLAPHLLRDGNGVIIGAVFDRARNRQLSAREISEDPRLAEPSLRTFHNLTRYYWGGYVGLLANASGDWWVTRDCSGMIPCYYTTVHGVTLVSSDARTIYSLNPPSQQSETALPIAINWQYIAGFLANSQLQIRDTGLKNLYELLAGETLCRHHGKLSVEMTWNPTAFTDIAPAESIETRRDALRTTAQSCIDAWASLHGRVVHSLSGGFDSSLVLALLSRSPNRPDIVCINRYSTGPAEDERHYARIAAHAAGVPLVEWPWKFGDQALNRSCLRHPFGAKPSIPTLLSPLEMSFFTVLRAVHPFDAIWTGEGGDHLFLALTTELIVTDFIRTHGFHHDLLEIVLNAARLTGRSIPGLLLRTIRTSGPASRTRSEMRSLDHSLLSARHFQRDGFNNYLRHPWANTTKDTTPGKMQQIMLLSEVLNRLRPLPGTQQAVELQPLLSQPLIEQCLATPTYDLLLGGRTRGLARQAFSSLLPSDIIHRESKGQTTHYLFNLIHHSLPFLSELLLDGVLVQQALVDRPALEVLLSRRISVDAAKVFALLSCVAAESWVRSWCGTDILPRTVACLPRGAVRSTNL